MKELYIKWLKDWFSQRKSLPDCVEQQNYFELGLIDSFGVIELIDAIETEFKIQFTQENFQDRRFSSIYGLAEIIEELNNE